MICTIHYSKCFNIARQERTQWGGARGGRWLTLNPLATKLKLKFPFLNHQNTQIKQN